MKASSQRCSAFPHHAQPDTKLQEFYWENWDLGGIKGLTTLLLNTHNVWKKTTRLGTISRNRITVLTLKTVSKAQTESKKASGWVHSSSYVWTAWMQHKNDCSKTSTGNFYIYFCLGFFFFFFFFFLYQKSYVQQIEFIHIYMSGFFTC